jgi:hypothetical protein
MDHHFPYIKKQKQKREKKLVRNSQNRRRAGLTHILALLTTGLY